ncbi:hypothetical protein A3C91_03185 [Candidatus Azambacteria bacterium RIFCSPHIGHO2_02_FULL_52_12]|uniref:Uncharacterized protein n=1 Tax=Candidatus Azambacteria bacterium RIFCSPLOWO2_01_FULL_46_25 TaxID=1797298 RepID=A0A1F5BU65_9BACT|nr:MAG: hypothetical protein A3C91_03185 [Candidatus Azambacteria bacterium RIFCSPHIGHO2_02_FULL_52_12]OGD34149.1 MAG: hypothetical protein A2988_01570 [Candidatus Azambacteria bacterium RIFCSPLOWO2_01_FULL_46_25]OGD36748.1 MAG: hypothetical protein A2850_00525 [Candidatus Azambacteria bacterium RIFCSPHIGHO2_01_FULL_51_74]
MSDKFTFSSAGLVHELELAMDRAGGYNAGLVKRMCQGDHLVHIREYLLGHAEVKMPKRIITCAAFFNPAEFLGGGWSIWKGPADGDGLSGEEDQDERSLMITELDLAELLFETCLKEKEEYIAGEEKLKRLKTKNSVLLGGRQFLALRQDWQKNGSESALEWLYETKGATYLDFPGLVLRRPDGRRCLLAFCRDGGGRWGWGYYWLGGDWFGDNPSAVLASN